MVDNLFLQESYWNPEEAPKFRSLKVPTREEASLLFGSTPPSSNVSIVREEVAVNEAEENCAVELLFQVAPDQRLGYYGVAVLELLSYLAYNSAYTQLRTQEQLGY